MMGDTFEFSISFPVESTGWRVRCRVDLSLDSTGGDSLEAEVDRIRIVEATHSSVTLEEGSCREFLKSHGLLREFCSDMIGYASLLQWTISRPVISE